MKRARRLPLLLMAGLVLAFSIASNGETDDRKPEADNGIRVSGVDVAVTGVGPVILLKADHKTVPIFVDTVVAASVQAALDEEPLPRPMTHDLMQTVLRAFDGKVTRVTILLHEGIFYGELEVTLRDTVKTFDSRSSDAIALAVRADAPIFVTKDVIESAGRRPEGQIM